MKLNGSSLVLLVIIILVGILVFAKRPSEKLDITQDEEPSYISHVIQNSRKQNVLDNPSNFFHFYPHLG